MNSPSPLLSLPPEIRNRIYGYVLGGNELHVNIVRQSRTTKRIKLEITICTAVIDEESAAIMIRHEEGDTEISDWHDRHHGCGVPGSKVSYSVALLKTCAQIHSETALLPFQMNTFIFNITEAFQTFHRKLMPIQRKAIRYMSLETGYFREHRGPMIPGALRWLKRMTGLKRIVLFEQFLAYSIVDFTSGAKDVIRDDLYGWLTYLGSSNLDSATICFYPGALASLHGQRYYYFTSVFSDLLPSAPSRIAYCNEVCEEVERMLLQKGGSEQGKEDGMKTHG